MNEQTSDEIGQKALKVRVCELRENKNQVSDYEVRSTEDRTFYDAELKNSSGHKGTQIHFQVHTLSNRECISGIVRRVTDAELK